MGLDTYLSVATYLDNFENTTPAERASYRKVLEEVGAGSFSPKHSIPFLTVKLLVAEWKNAYAIHRWIVEHAQDGDDIRATEREIPRECLQELLELCKHLLQKKSRKEAERLLPPPEHLFSKREDSEDLWREGYWWGLKGTIRQMSAVLENPTFDDWEFFYSAS